jgi:Tfp pilus assembly protein PilW
MSVMHDHHLLPLAPTAEHGTSLMELLVAMLCSLVVLGALLAILEFSLHQEAHIADAVQADQIGRTTMTKIVEGLRSGCAGNGATGIQVPTPTPKAWPEVPSVAASNRVNLWFVSAYGSKSAGAAEVTEVFEHDINWNSTGKTTSSGKQIGTLTDYVFEGTGSPNQWKFPEFTEANAKARELAKNVIAPFVKEEGVEQPTIFQYSKYNNNSAEPLLYGHLVPLSTSSEVSIAAKGGEIAEATVSFTQASVSGNTETNRTANLSSSVVLRFNSSQTGEAVNRPCE